MTSGAEREEALVLASALHRFAAEAQILMLREKASANELKIVIDESAGKSMTPDFRSKVDKNLDVLRQIRERRREMAEVVGQGVYQTPMVFRVQHGAVDMLQSEIARDDVWIQLIQNVRTRAELGRQQPAPEWADLTKEMDSYLAQTPEMPLESEISGLRQEYRFGESEIKP